MQAGYEKVEEYLKRFEVLIAALQQRILVESVGPYMFVLGPKEPLSGASNQKQEKDVMLTISALIHGVEVAGLAVIVELLELVTRGSLRLNGPVGIALGNTGAARRGVRFVERDLNRSFGRIQATLAEEKRADELERLFTRSKYLLDIHQVKLQIDRPFWIFPYTKEGYKFARAVAPEVSVITHWGRGFSQEGQCSDEWVNGQGGTGVTIELGQNGFDPAQIKHGLSCCVRALEVASGEASERHIMESGSMEVAPLYTWGEIVAYPPTGQPVLSPGWYNFKIVKAGDVLGHFNGDTIKAQVTGPVLFPKYPDVRPDGTYGDSPPAAELIRILREISENDLPKA